MERKTWRQRNTAEYNAAWRRWYSKNASRKIEWQQRRRKELRAWLCEESAPECLHFHHANPAEKELDVSNAIANGWSRTRILREIAKCHVLCANCHLKRHWEERKL